jgi:UDP-N-acetylglucosamine 4,6-dehydratase
MNLSGSTVLITGGTGSWGQAATNRLLTMADGPRRVCVFSRDEVKQAEMRRVFGDDPRLRFFLGDVRDRERLRIAMLDVQYVFHAAALKRIESCAYNPTEAMSTNVLGSMNVMAAAMERGVLKVVALSTDKACAPSTTYGASKACMEHVFTSSASYVNNRTTFAVVRYGNVANSRGSVIPRWRELVQAGRPLPITNRDATRFWFTLGGAVDLAFWTMRNASGGELVVPDLPSFRLEDLAIAIAYPEDPDFEPMEMVPGEKLHESMISSDEAREFKSVDGMFVRSAVLGGWKLPEGFELRSDKPRTWLNIAALRERLKTV